MYTMSDIADALMIHRELHDQMPFQNVLAIMDKAQQSHLIDILSDLYMIKEIIEPMPWYEPAWSKDQKYIWVWSENDS